MDRFCELFNRSESAKLAKSTVSRWETGETEPMLSSVDYISHFFGVSPLWLIGASDDRYAKRSIPASGPVRVPVYGNVAAGIPIEAITNIEDWEEIPASLASQGEYVALKIHGDSMLPRMQDGDVVIVRIQPSVESGDTAIVFINGQDATCKKVKLMPDGILLMSSNPAYEPIYYTQAQVESLPVRIFGKVVELRCKM